jgi:putative ATP-binding cassette transporter
MTSTPQQSAEEAAARKAAAEQAASGLRRQLGMMIRALRGSPVAKTLVALCVTVVLVIAATAYGQIRLNS